MSVPAAGTDPTFAPLVTVPNRQRWTIVGLLFTASVINYFDRATISFALPLISRDLQLGPEAKGLLLSAFFWSYTLMQIPMGVLAEISHLTQRNRVLVMDMLMDPGTSNLEASHAALTANVERIQALWKDYAAKPLGAEEQALAQAFADANATYLDKGLIPASAALVAGKYDDGSELYITQIRPNALKVQDAIERLVALQINVAAAEFAGARAMSDTIHWWMLAATALALLAGAAMAWVITRSISRPLRQAVVLARTVAGGDLTAQIEVRGNDEWIQRHLHCDSAEQCGDHDKYSCNRRRDEYARVFAIAPRAKCGNEERDDGECESERDVAMRDLDDEIDAVMRREPQTIALGPVITAAHAGAGDSHDRAEYNLRECENERDQRKAAECLHQ